MLCKDSQSKKVLSSIFVTDLGITTESLSFKHRINLFSSKSISKSSSTINLPECDVSSIPNGKACPPISVTDSGITMLCRDLQP